MANATVRLVFLGRLADLSGPMTVPPGRPVAWPISTFPRAYIRLALNGELVSADGLMLTEGDELAFLPPVSGG